MPVLLFLLARLLRRCNIMNDVNPEHSGFSIWVGPVEYCFRCTSESIKHKLVSGCCPLLCGCAV